MVRIVRVRRGNGKRGPRRHAGEATEPRRGSDEATERRKVGAAAVRAPSASERVRAAPQVRAPNASERVCAARDVRGNAGRWERGDVGTGEATERRLVWHGRVPRATTAPNTRCSSRKRPSPATPRPCQEQWHTVRYAGGMVTSSQRVSAASVTSQLVLAAGSNATSPQRNAPPVEKRPPPARMIQIRTRPGGIGQLWPVGASSTSSMKRGQDATRVARVGPAPGTCSG